MCQKCGSDKHHSDDYTVDPHNKRAREVRKLNSVKNHFTKALDYKNCRLVKQPQKYGGHISGRIAKWARHMDVSMKSAAFKPSDPMSILSFSTTPRRHVTQMETKKDSQCGRSNISWKPRQSCFRILCVYHGKRGTQKERKLTTYCEIVSYLLVKYATGDVIVVAETERKNFKHPRHMSVVRYLDV